eukprot:3548866-Ditylum_brightwellii.AAC.1
MPALIGTVLFEFSKRLPSRKSNPTEKPNDLGREETKLSLPSSVRYLTAAAYTALSGLPGTMAFNAAS